MRTYRILNEHGHVVGEQTNDDAIRPPLLKGHTAQLVAIDGEPVPDAEVPDAEVPDTDAPVPEVTTAVEPEVATVEAEHDDRDYHQA